MNNRRPVARVKALQAEDRKLKFSRQWSMLAVSAVALLLLLLSVSSAQAQFPRLGLSASSNHYEPVISAEFNEEFELYVCVFGIDENTPLEQDFSSISWVLHQVCCGAALVVNSIDFNPNFHHEGLPSLGVVSSAETCIEEPALLLATLHVNMIADEDGAYLIASGPYQQAVDCDGNNPIMMGMALTVNLSGVSVPVESDSWDSIKSFYR